MPYQQLQEQLIQDLDAIYDAESQFIAAIEVMLQQASNPRLQQGLRMHVDQTREQINNLNRVFRQLGRQRSGESNAAAQGLVDMGRRMLEQAGTPPLRDLAICNAQARVEQFESACYIGLANAMQTIGQSSIAALLRQNLQQEQQMAQQLQQLMLHLLHPAMEAEGMLPNTEKAPAGAAKGDSKGTEVDPDLSVDVDAAVSPDTLIHGMESAHGQS